jgi:hypothetical protein
MDANPTGLISPTLHLFSSLLVFSLHLAYRVRSIDELVAEEIFHPCNMILSIANLVKMETLSS